MEKKIKHRFNPDGCGYHLCNERGVLGIDDNYCCTDRWDRVNCKKCLKLKEAKT